MARSEEQIRYVASVDPVRTDGRDIDTGIAVLSGEASDQEVTSESGQVQEIAPKPWDRVPTVTADDTTYYDRPMLKQSVWSIDIPLYYFVGGAAGAALALGAAVQLGCRTKSCERELRKFSKTCHWIGIVGSTIGAGLLIHDLGKPSRFLNMMRVFRPTSPMNVGAWILGGAAPAAITTGLLINRPGLLGLIGEATGYASGVFGLGLAGYTGVLVSNSAIPIWQASRRWMAPLFMASSMAAAASVIDMFYEGERANRISCTFGNIGRVAEIAAAKQVERSASVVPRVGEPFHKGATSILWKSATALTVASLGISLLPGRSSAKRRTAGILGAIGSLCLRFGVHYLTNASARDARAAFQQQRAGAAVHGGPAAAKMPMQERGGAKIFTGTSGE